MMSNPQPDAPATATEVFVAHRELLFSIVYNMLGSVADNLRRAAGDLGGVSLLDGRRLLDYSGSDAEKVGLLALKARHADKQERQQGEGAVTGSSPATEDERELSNAVKPVHRHGTYRPASPPGALGNVAPRHNLPLYRTPFVGRQHELGLVQSKLLRDDVALLTLIGPGGAGKSRLAVQAARSVLENFPHCALTNWHTGLAIRTVLTQRCAMLANYSVLELPKPSRSYRGVGSR